MLEKHLYMCDVQVPWGNSVILVGGKTEPASDHLSGLQMLCDSPKHLQIRSCLAQPYNG